MIRNEILQGDVLEVARGLPSRSVNTIVTSPPYYQQRDYGLPPTDWPEVAYAPLHGLPTITIPAMKKCLGREKTIEAYVGHMVLALRLLRSGLRADGVVWLNIGDKRANDSKTGGASGNKNYTSVSGGYNNIRENPAKTGLPDKNLCGIPWRLALALQADGWVLRSDVIWHKSNGSPSSAGDRPTDAHEYLFLLSNQSHYWYDAEAIKTPAKQISEKANRRTIWKMSTAQYPGAHFAVMPAEVAKLCILSGCPPYTCAECDMPYIRVIEKTGYKHNREPAHTPNNTPTKIDSTGWKSTTRSTGKFMPDCDCNAPTRPGIVLDPFFGSGTTAQVAIENKRDWLGIELSREYIKLAKERIWKTQPVLFAI